MKEIPNSTISIEAKNKNATRYTKIYCSMILSNNLPRDNYLSFDARKFAPVELSKKRLEKVMRTGEIETIQKKLSDESLETYDVAYVAQIGRWILKNGNKPDKFPQGEYRGRKFWELAHSSMALWQRLTLDFLKNPKKYDRRNYKKYVDKLNDGKLEFSHVRDLVVDSTDVKNASRHFPIDHSTARHFLNIFRDLSGEKIYETLDLEEEDSVGGDFYVKIIDPIVLLDEETANLL